MIAGSSLSSTRRVPVRSTTRFVRASVPGTFTLVGSPKSNIQVVVVDTQLYGLRVVRDLRLVFPDLRVLALTNGPKGTLAALQAGATMALPRSSSAAELANAIDQLAHPRG
jgi:DNA-binding NarL/FixJ family response regulator